jgi:hypothetical protein
MGINIYDAPFYKPPQASDPYPGDIPSGQIILFKDASWGSESVTIDTNSGAYPEGYPFSFSGTGLQDNATWIAFKLPTGTVCTLFDNTVNLAAGAPPFNPAGAGVPVDLIGNDQVQTVDLSAYGANDRLSSGIWRQVDLNDGWFQLFRDTNNQGSFITIFFSEWPTNTPVSLDGWDIDGQASSVNYPSLTPPQVVVLTNQTDGTGYPLALGATNPYPSGDSSTVTPATVNLTDRGINDQVHSFTYSIIEPVKAVIDSVSIQPTLNEKTSFGVSETIIGTNYSPEPVVIATNVFENLTYTVTSTTTLQYTTAVQLTVSSQVTAGIELSGLKLSDQETITTQVTTTIQDTFTKTVTTTEIFQAGQTITFTAPPSSAPLDTSKSGAAAKGAAYAAMATITLGNLQSDQDPMAQTVTTTGHFYYRQNLPGSMPDPANTGLFILDMSITISLSGLIGTQINFDVDDISDATAALIRKKNGANANLNNKTLNTKTLNTKVSHAAAKHLPPAAHGHKHKAVMQKAARRVAGH